MKEKPTEVETIMIDATCDIYGCEGILVYTGITFTSFPPQYQHVCQRCGLTENLKHLYPRIEYRKKL